MKVGFTPALVCALQGPLRLGKTVMRCQRRVAYVFVVKHGPWLEVVKSPY